MKDAHNVSPSEPSTGRRAGGGRQAKRAARSGRNPRTGDTIKIGFIVPLTGAFSVEAQAQVKGAELAVKEFNDAGGLKGRRAELLVRDYL